jgi:hypothetical protein
MGTATLKSILERIVDQMINVNATDKSPTHKNGEEKTPFKKTTLSSNPVI